jgi:hypothetical protein
VATVTGTAPSSLAAATVQIVANPNPVPFSGAPITDAAECANYAFTWFYDTVLQETAGSEVRFTSRIDTFDDKTANNLQGLNIVLGPHSSLTLHTRWCSGSSTAHTTQSSFTGVDASGNAVSAMGPAVRLMAKGR